MAVLVNLVISVAGLCSWVLFLGGLSASTNSCDQATKGNNDYNDRADACGIRYSLAWWVLFYELLALLLALLMSIVARLLAFKLTLAIFFTMTTTLLMGITNTFVLLEFDATKVHDQQVDGWRASIAGCILLMLCNFAWLIYNTADWGVAAVSMPTIRIMSNRPATTDNLPAHTAGKQQAPATSGV